MMDKDTKHVGKLAVFCTALVIVVATLAIMTARQVSAQNFGAEEGKADAVVGTYDEQMAFQKYPGREKLTEAYESAQEEMGEAQEQGNQQKLQQVQQRLQKTQEEVIGQFQSDVRDELPDIARKIGVKVVALDVVYTADDVEARDITPQVIEAIGGDPEEQPAP